MRASKIIALLALMLCAMGVTAQVDREESREFHQMLKDAIGEVDSTKYPVLKLYPVTVTDRSWYDNSRVGIDIRGERSPVKKGLFTYDPLDTLGRSFAVKVDADLIAQGLADAGYDISGVMRSHSLYYYNAGDSCWVLADTLGITFHKGSGTDTIRVPEDVTILEANIFGSLSDLDGSDRYYITIDHTSVGYNTGAGDMRIPDFQIVNCTALVGGGPSTAMPFIYDEGNAPQRQIVGVGSGDLSLRAINMDVFSYWVINLGF